MKGPLAQDDPRVLNYIRSNGFLVSPSRLPYNLTDPTEDPSMGQSQVVRQILKSMVSLRGFFNLNFGANLLLDPPCHTMEIPRYAVYPSTLCGSPA